MNTELIIPIFLTGLACGFYAGYLARKKIDYYTLKIAHLKGADDALRIISECILKDFDKEVSRRALLENEIAALGKDQRR